ncbi:DNA methyltransferase [Treponema endosymbiont of Eucomonympha sp.]|uniref:DNA methyltransferase n=1 Tax=Treponema endosymbiont of Eucomonympha sp. TaxID=1580831 RepID=UPI0007508FA9|nr:DNA methyltransferase [Treponema endosymbiont of Eucomonympha sp.]
MNFLDTVFYKDSRTMSELPDNSVQLIVTSPPYFNIKDYSLDGYQEKKTGKKEKGQIGDIADYDEYIEQLLIVWKECERVLKPNGKMAVNAPIGEPAGDIRMIDSTYIKAHADACGACGGTQDISRTKGG